MTVFWLGAAVLVLLALSFLLGPLWRDRVQAGRWSRSGLITSLAIAPAAIAFYFAVTTWNPNAGDTASPEERAMVTQLAAKLVENPDDVQGWLLLGRSYMVLGEYALARQAYIEAWRRTPVPDNELKLALGEALILTDRAGLNPEGAQLIEEVLGAEPNNQRALWYGGLIAMEIGQTDMARTRWTRFLAFNPPEEVAGTVRRLLSELPAESSDGSSVVPGGFELALDVSLAEGVSAQPIASGAALFIFARAPNERAPVAVIRESVGGLPGRFSLSDGNVMIAGRSLTDFPELSLVARISLSGQPAEQSGDLFAEAVYRQGDDPMIALVIDQVVP
jgi:cytochrome c-type biogenesis protein CcmH